MLSHTLQGMEIETLVPLARMGCCHDVINISSAELARELGTSQQTTSRRLKHLEAGGYIHRDIHPRGQRIVISEKGIEELMRLKKDLDAIFEARQDHIVSFTGEVVSGLGEGSYYVTLPGYHHQFKEVLGFEPYPGTLNLKLRKGEDIKARHMLQEAGGMDIDGFQNGARTFGPVRAYRANIGGIEGAFIIPKRTHHGIDTIELIAPVKIRDRLKLEDGSILTVKIMV
jgi:riboflavin kinase